jgi:hypothetical protein
MALPSLVEEGVVTLPPKKPERKIQAVKELTDNVNTAEE